MAERIAIVSSPRSGNSWVRALLRDGLNLPDIAVHNFVDVTCLPEACVLQLHWYREPNFQHFLSDSRFRIVTISRHPLDILLSVLHFINYEPETARWLDGNCDIPSSLIGKAPTSHEFMEYSLSFGAENLLSVTYQWWHDQDAIKIRYEDLVADTENELGRFAEKLNVPRQRILDVTAAHSLETFQAMPNRHGWQGQPGLWQTLIPFESAVRVFERNRNIFDKLGYTVEPTPLTPAEAARNWESLRR